MNKFDLEIMSYEEYLIIKRSFPNIEVPYYRYRIIDRDTLNVVLKTNNKTEIKLKLDLLNLQIEFNKIKRSHLRLGSSSKNYYLFIPLKEKE